jgi:hypothetical protein
MVGSPPGVVNADAEVQGRKLRAIVRSACLLGACFLFIGVLVMGVAIPRFRRDPITLLVASSLTSSGVLYIVFGVFLRRRRFWAWVAMLVMTIVLLAGVTVFAILVVSNVVREFGRREPELYMVVLMLLGPGLWLGCWMAALILILRYLGQSLPAVREQEAVAQKGFAVIPVGGVAAAREEN